MRLSILKKVNQLYSSSISSKFTITLGDEFQGLLHSGDNVMEIIQYIKKETYPIEIRFGIGIGSISTNINPEISIGADGPGYHRARDCIEELKMMERRKQRVLSDVQIKIDEDNFLQELSLNSILKLMYSIESNWTEKQKEIINYILFKKKSQIEVAQYFNVSQSNIQQILSKAHYYAYKDAIDSINKILCEVKYNDSV